MYRSIVKIRADIAAHPSRSAWVKGVRGYAMELFDDYVEGLHIDDSGWIEKITEKDLMSGAESWQQYSYGGCAEVYDEDICERLCTESEKKKTRNGQWRLNSNEDWLDVQTRALKQAARIVLRYANRRG